MWDLVTVFEFPVPGNFCLQVPEIKAGNTGELTGLPSAIESLVFFPRTVKQERAQSEHPYGQERIFKNLRRFPCRHDFVALWVGRAVNCAADKLVRELHLRRASTGGASAGGGGTGGGP